MSRRLLAFQAHHTDLLPGLAERNAVEPLVASGLFDDVVLAAADVPANAALAPWAERWGVALVLGDEHDVARRLLACAEARGATTVARALLPWFFVDPELVRRELEALEASDADRVRLPSDFDLRFGVDAMRPRFLAAAIRGMAETGEADRHRRNPWGFAEAHPDRFRTLVLDDVPTYGRARFDAVRAGVRALWPERWDGAATPLAPYRLALGLLPAGGRALDLACGLGAGTALLATRGHALGVDAEPAALATARRRYGEVAAFARGDAARLALAPGSLDLVTSIHTLEHLPDDRAVLARMATWLAPSGRLVLEVPLLPRRPFVGIDEPLAPAHLREYDVPGLLALVRERFEPERVLGVARGAYVPPERAESAALVVARPRAGVA